MAQINYTYVSRWVDDDYTRVTDLDNDDENHRLTDQGFTIRHIETWHLDMGSESFVVWDGPEITEADLPY
jgi:hypothetical protein